MLLVLILCGLTALARVLNAMSYIRVYICLSCFLSAVAEIIFEWVLCMLNHQLFKGYYLVAGLMDSNSTQQVPSTILSKSTNIFFIKMFNGVSLFRQCNNNFIILLIWILANFDNHWPDKFFSCGCRYCHVNVWEINAGCKRV